MSMNEHSVFCYPIRQRKAHRRLDARETISFMQLASVLIVFQAIYDTAGNSLIGLELMQINMWIVAPLLKPVFDYGRRYLL
jgi:hypothetical protein